MAASGKSELPARNSSCSKSRPNYSQQSATRGPGTLAPIVRTELDEVGSVPPDNRPSSALEHDGWQDRGTETPASLF